MMLGHHTIAAAPIASSEAFETGTGNINSTIPVLEGVEMALAGSGDVQPAVATVSGTGTRIGTGSGNTNSTVPVVAGVGTRIITGSGNVSSTLPVIAATGDPPDGSGNVNSTVPTVAGSGTRIITGSGNVNNTQPSVAGTGAKTMYGSGAINLVAPLVLGSASDFVLPPIDVKRKRGGNQGRKTQVDGITTGKRTSD